MSVDSPRWVGAWWVGFVICSIILFVLSIPILGYPKHLPSTLTRKITLSHIDQHCSSNRFGLLASSRVSSNDNDDGVLAGETQGLRTTELYDTQEQTMQEISAVCTSRSQGMDADGQHPAIQPSSWMHFQVVHLFFCDFVEVITNKAFIFLSLAAAVTSTIVSGFLTFGPKFVESQFSKSASDAANLFGYVCIPAGAGGMLLGGSLMTGFKLDHKSSLTMCFCVSVIGLFALFTFSLHCDDVPLAGINVPYNESSNLKSLGFLSSSCNSYCSCSLNIFEPVCGSDDVTYYSPCFAACTRTTQSSVTTYSNCSCIPPLFESSGNSTLSSTGSAVMGKCSITCKWYNLLLAGLFLVISTTFMCAVPGADLTLRIFPHRLRSLCIGIQWIIIRTLGTIPGPIIFGAMIDSTCLMWSQQNSCSDGKGSCTMYKNEELSFSLLILSVIYKGACIIFFGLALFLYKPAQHEDNSPIQSRRASVESPL